MITKMTWQHIKKISELEEICFSHPWSEKSLLEELENENSCFLVYLNDLNTENIIGYGGMHTPFGECYIDNIAVFPEYRGMGYGEKITTALISEAVKLNGQFISLEVRPSNLVGINLYKKLGFKEVGERKNFYQNPLENCLIMTREL